MSTNIMEAGSALVGGKQMSIQRLVRAYVLEMYYEFLRTLRNPGFGIPFIILPVGLFTVFSAMDPGGAQAATPEARLQLFAGMSIFGIMGPPMFGFGAYLAIERQMKQLEFRRAIPMPPGAHLLAKMTCALAYALIVIVSMLTVATLMHKVSFTALQMALIALILLLGVAPFCAIGFFIGSRASGPAASGITTLLFLPLVYLSGLFFPLPKVIEVIALVMPPFYLKELVLAVGGGKPIWIGGPLVHVVLLVTFTFILSALAAKRLARTG
jgi:ABC-2 type transport system permease protein